MRIETIEVFCRTASTCQFQPCNRAWSHRSTSFFPCPTRPKPCQPLSHGAFTLPPLASYRCKPARRIERFAHPTSEPKVRRKVMTPCRELRELPAPEYPLEIGPRTPARLPPCPRRHSPASLRQTRTAGMVAPSLPESRPFQRGATPCDRP